MILIYSQLYDHATFKHEIILRFASTGTTYLKDKLSQFEQIMDRPSAISTCTEQGIAVDSAKNQNSEVIQTVANKLAIIGDELSLSYQDLSSNSRVSFDKFKSCTTLEGCLDILLSVLKAWNWKFKQIAEAKPSSEMHERTWKQG